MKASLLVVTDQGDLLCYHKDRVMIIDTHCKLIKRSMKVANVVSLAQCKENVFIAAMDQEQFICERFNYKLREKTKICDFKLESQSEQQMAVQETELIVIDDFSNCSQLRIYNFTGSLLRKVFLGEKALQISLLPQGHVLIKCSDLHIARYDITEAKPKRIWRSKEEYNLVSRDNAGLCYCNSPKDNSDQEIQLVTSETSSGKFKL